MQDKNMVNAQGRAGTNFVEGSQENTAVRQLNELISANRGLINVYQTAAERLENEPNKALLQSYIEQHEGFLTELSDVVVGLSGRFETDSTTSSLIKRAWVTLKAAVTQGDGPILVEVAQDVESVLDAYGETLSQELPEQASRVIRKQMGETRMTYEKLSGLSAAYNS